MVQMKPVFMLLQAEITSILYPEGSPKVDGKHIVEPWGYEKMPTFLRFQNHDDPNYPREGVSRVSKDNVDIQEFLTRDGDWEKYQAFLEEFRQNIFSPDTLYELTVQTQRNIHKEGANIAMKYLHKLLDRAKTNVVVEKLLREENGAPYQVYERFLAKWPSRRTTGKRKTAPEPESVHTVWAMGSRLLWRLYGRPFTYDDELGAASLTVAKALICAAWARQRNRARKSESRVLELREEKERTKNAVKESSDKTPLQRAELLKAWEKALTAYWKEFEWQSTDSQVAEIMEEQNEIKALIAASARAGKVTDAKLKGLEREFMGPDDPVLITKMENDYADNADTFNDLKEGALVRRGGSEKRGRTELTDDVLLAPATKHRRIYCEDGAGLEKEFGMTQISPRINKIPASKSELLSMSVVNGRIGTGQEVEVWR